MLFFSVIPLKPPRNGSGSPYGLYGTILHCP